jgi:hypothetical protein
MLVAGVVGVPRRRQRAPALPGPLAAACLRRGTPCFPDPAMSQRDRPAGSVAAGPVVLVWLIDLADCFPRVLRWSSRRIEIVRLPLPSVFADG